MKTEAVVFIYLIIINILSGVMFIFDKQAAIRNRQRTPESTLHVLEMLGGVFTNLLLMYCLHHKNRKFRYYGVTWVVMMGWVGIIIWIWY